MKVKFTYSCNHGRRRSSNLGVGAIKLPPELSNRAGEQAEKFLEFPIVLSENSV